MPKLAGLPVFLSPHPQPLYAVEGTFRATGTHLELELANGLGLQSIKEPPGGLFLILRRPK